MALKALIFDCDGTLAETEEAHRTAFNQAFRNAGLGWHWSVDRYRVLLKVTGGRERIAHFMAEEGLPPIDISTLHAAKNAIYATLIESGEVALRPGVLRLMQEAQAAGIALAVATTTSRSNLDKLIAATPLSALNFVALVTGEDVSRKKPDPEAYVIALERLSLLASECLAFEDSENGLRAARAAGLATIVTPGVYTAGEEFGQASLLLADLGNVTDLSRFEPILAAGQSQTYLTPAANRAAPSGAIHD
jgi:HAD superfamily hydrolase (TIGR01509 family)